jgi:secreted trypsin-like serine protease
MMFSISPVTNSRLLRRLEKSGIALNGDAESPRDGDDLTVAGFGYTQEGGGGDEPRRLLQANVTSVPASDCGASYPGAFDATVMLCAGRPDGSADTCDGDSGGPAVLAAAAEGPDNGTSAGSLLVGVTSWGIGCGRPEHPGVYARVSAGLPWIRETLCSLSSDPPAYCAK